MSKVVVVSFGTEKPEKYRRYAEELRENCSALGIEHDVDVIPDLGGYKANNRYKPTFIYSKLLKHECPVVWFDADGGWRKKFEIPEEALNALDIGLVESPRLYAGENWVLPWTCGCILFNHTMETFNFLAAWARLCASDRTTPNEHRILLKMLDVPKYAESVRIKDVTRYFRGTWAVDSRRDDRRTYES